MGKTGTHSDGVPIIAYCVRRASGRVLAERLADEQFYAASTVKLAVLVAVARALEAGSVTLETPMTSADTFQSEAPGAPDFHIDPDDLDDGMPPPGTPMPLADVVERMVVVSSNEATNMVVELVGRDGATLRWRMPARRRARSDASTPTSPPLPRWVAATARPPAIWRR